MEEPARKFRRPVDGHLAVEVVLADVRGENGGRLIAADSSAERFLQIGAAVAEAVAHGVEYSTRVGVVLEADGGAARDAELLAAAAHRAQVKVGHETVAQEAVLLLGEVERVQPAAEAERCRRQLAERGRRLSSGAQMLLAALSTTNAGAAAAVAARTSARGERSNLPIISLSLSLSLSHSQNVFGRL